MGKRRPNLRLPEVIILYIRPNGEGHMSGAKQQTDGTWLYSKWVVLPPGDTTDFIEDTTAHEGYIAFDCRESAKAKTPGMENATPVILYRSKQVSLKDAVEASTKLHLAIINSPD